MANTILLKRSATASNVPTAGEISTGELAINTADKILYSKDATTVFAIGLYRNVAETISSAWTFNSGIDMADSTLTTPKLDDYSIVASSATVSANAVTLTYSTAQAWEVDLEAATGAVTITLTGGPPAGTYGEMIVKVQQDTTAARTITWAGGTFEWPGGTAPVMTATADAFDIFHFCTWNGGTNWWGSAIQDVK